MRLEKKIAYIILGTVILGAAMGCYINVGIGSDSISAFLDGFSSMTGLKPGTVSILLNGTFLIATFFMDKKRIGVATLICLFGTKYPIDFMVEHFPTPSNVIICCLIDIFLCGCFGIACALIIKGDMGASAYDGFTLSLTEKLKKKYTIVRYVCDGTLLVIAFLIGGKIGLGTIIAFIFSGPMFNFFLKVLKCK